MNTVSGFKIAQTNSSLPCSLGLSGMVNNGVMLCLSTSSDNKWRTTAERFPPARRRTSYLASGVPGAAADLVGLGCDLAGDVAASFLDGFGASVLGVGGWVGRIGAALTLHARHGRRGVPSRAFFFLSFFF